MFGEVKIWTQRSLLLTKDLEAEIEVGGKKVCCLPWASFCFWAHVLTVNVLSLLNFRSHTFRIVVFRAVYQPVYLVSFDEIIRAGPEKGV